MTLPDDLHSLVDRLAVAKKKLGHAEEEVAKMKTLQTEIELLHHKLTLILDKAGFDESAIDLLLAAR